MNISLLNGITSCIWNIVIHKHTDNPLLGALWLLLHKLRASKLLMLPGANMKPTPPIPSIKPNKIYNWLNGLHSLILPMKHICTLNTNKKKMLFVTQPWRSRIPWLKGRKGRNSVIGIYQVSCFTMELSFFPSSTPKDSHSFHSTHMPPYHQLEDWRQSFCRVSFIRRLSHLLSPTR